jgi:hypothetical protein
MDSAFSVGDVVAHVKADVTDFKKGIDSAKDSTKGLHDTMSKVSSGIGTIAKQSAIFAAVIGGAAIVFSKQAVDAYKEAEAADKQLEHAVLNVTHATKQQLQATKDLSDALERKGVLDGDNIKTGLAQLSTFGLSNKAVQGLGGSLADLAVNQFGVSASGEQLTQTANMIAKALNGQFGVLEKSGIRFTAAQKAIIETGTEMEKVKAINEGFAQNLKYTNDVALTTFEGKMAKMNVVFGNIKEGIGKVIVDALMPLVDILTKVAGNQRFLDFIERIKDVFSGLIAVLATGDLKGSFLRALGIDEDGRAAGLLLKLHEGLVFIGEWINEHQELVLTFLKGLAVALGALLIIGTIAILIATITNPLFLLVGAITLLYTAWQTNFLGLRDITQQVFDVLRIMFAGYIEMFQDLVNWIRAHWEQIKATFQGALDIIVGQMRFYWAIISGIFKVALALLKGDWDGAWEAFKGIFSNAWAALRQMFGGALSMMEAWGGDVFNKLTEPFRRAWNEIQNLVNKIKDALDFTKRHSPSVIDIINKGVNLANRAFDNLDFAMPGINPSISSTISPAGSNANYNNINLDLSGAIISDEAGAERIGEVIGDSIINKLQKNIRI